MNPISSHQYLQNLVGTGKLDIINVTGLPRSNGTALHVALTQAKAVTPQEVIVQLYEPFYYPDLKGHLWKYIPLAKPLRTFDDRCQFIIKRYEEESPNEKVKLIIHELSQNLIDE